MAILNDCLVKTKGEDSVRGWAHDATREPPYTWYDAKNDGYEVVCPCCLMSTGLYLTEKEAESRWDILTSAKLTLEEYLALPFSETFPDHEEGNIKKLKPTKTRR